MTTGAFAELLQAQLVEELHKSYSKEAIICEQDFVDVRVETEDEIIYYEIKTELDPRTVIRQAMGQLLEYAYHPLRNGRQPDKLVIVGRGALDSSNEKYLDRLSKDFHLPLSYMQVEI